MCWAKQIQSIQYTKFKTNSCAKKKETKIITSSYMDYPRERRSTHKAIQSTSHIGVSDQYSTTTTSSPQLEGADVRLPALEDPLGK